MVNHAYDAMFDAAGRHYNVDPALLKTIFHVESGGNINAPRGSSGEIGAMQFMPSTAQAMNVSDPTDMRQAIPAAAQIIRKGLDDNHGDPAAALRTYNGGPGGVNNPATIDYVMKAQKLYPQMAIHKASAKPAAEDDDASVALGRSVIEGQTSTPKTNEDDPSVELGRSVINQSVDNAPAAVQAAPAASQAPVAQVAPRNALQAPAAMPKGASPTLDAISPDISQNPIVMKLRSALQGGQNDYQMQGLGRFLPLAHDEVTGENRLAVPQVVQQLGNGALDLLQGPRTGTVTPDARAALTAAIMGGKLTPSPASAKVMNIPTPPEVQAANTERAANAMTSPEFRNNPFSKDYAPKTPAGETMSNPNVTMPKGTPTPNENPNSTQTQQFSDIIKNMVVEELKKKGSSYIGKTIQGAIVGHQIAGPHGAVAGAIINNLIAHLNPKIRDAVLSNLKDFDFAKHAVIGGSAGAALEDDKPK